MSAEQRPASAITIRRAELTDAPVLATLMEELGYQTRTAEMEMRLQPIFANNSYTTLVAVLDGQVCGMIGTVCQSSYEHNNIGARIVALVVKEQMRGRGVGGELVRAAEADLSAKNIRRVALNTRLQREEAHRFYEKLGYAKNGFRFVKELPPAGD